MRLYILLFFSCMAFAQFASPPLDELMANNSETAAALEGYYNSSFAQNGTVLLRVGSYTQPANISASVIVLGLSPSLDNMSCAAEGMGLVSARGHEEGHLIAMPSQGYPDFTCDRYWFEHGNPDYGWRCDFDADYCPEYEDELSVSYDLNATFAIRNVSESVLYSSTYLEIPGPVMDEIRNASGAENLSVNISGNVTFIYRINDRVFEYNDCSDNYTNISGSIPISINSTFLVGGSEKLFFLKAPILREQWYRNNRFDMVALSQCPLYRAEIWLNNVSATNMTIREFGLLSDEFGFMKMVSNLSPASGFAEYGGAVANPLPLEARNNSFAFAYSFNFTYPGLGENNLSIIVHDSSGNGSQYNDTLASRMLSYDSQYTENGGKAANGSYRPSTGFSRGSLTHLEIGLGLVGLVLVLAFLNFWIPK